MFYFILKNKLLHHLFCHLGKFKAASTFKPGVISNAHYMSHDSTQCGSFHNLDSCTENDKLIQGCVAETFSEKCNKKPN